MLFAVIYLLLGRLDAIAGGSSEDRHNVKGTKISDRAVSRSF